MPVSGLLITLAAEEALSETALGLIRRDDRIEVGRRVGSRVPIVVDTPDRKTDGEVFDWLQSMPGVQFVDVVFVHFDDRPSRDAVGIRGRPACDSHR